MNRAPSLMLSSTRPTHRPSASTCDTMKPRRPNIRVASAVLMCPPSRGGTGSRFSTAHHMLAKKKLLRKKSTISERPSTCVSTIRHRMPSVSPASGPAKLLTTSLCQTRGASVLGRVTPPMNTRSTLGW
jgi:hypothetical protein